MHGAAGFGEKLRDVVGVGHGGRRAALRAARRLKSPLPREKTDVERRATPSPLPSQAAGQLPSYELPLHTRPAFRSGLRKKSAPALANAESPGL